MNILMLTPETEFVNEKVLKSEAVNNECYFYKKR